MSKGKTVRRPAASANTLVPYIDRERDLRDLAIGTAIRNVLKIVQHDDNDVADLLRLALWSLETSWPVTAKKFTGELAHG